LLGGAAAAPRLAHFTSPTARAAPRAPAQDVAHTIKGATEPTTAQKVAGGVDWSLQQVNDAAGSVVRAMQPEPTTAQKVAGGGDSVLEQTKDAAGSVAHTITGATPEPTTAQKVAGGVDSVLQKAEEAAASAVHTIKGDTHPAA